jgi:hypothetical protein
MFFSSASVNIKRKSTQQLLLLVVMLFFIEMKTGKNQHENCDARLEFNVVFHQQSSRIGRKNPFEY